MKPIQVVFPRILLLVLLTISLICCAETENSDARKTKRVFLAPGEIHEGWFFAAGDQVMIEGTVNGDAYVAGGVVEIDGIINGDLLVGGGQVTVSGAVSDDIRVAGGVVRLNGKVGKNISAAGGTITIGKTAAVGGSVLSACGNFQVAGTIEGEAKVAAGDMTVTGTIMRNVDFVGDNLSVLSGAKIGGNVQIRVREKEHVEITEGTVIGKVDILTREEKPFQEIFGLHPIHFWFKILWACSLLLTGLVLVFAFPRQLTGIGTTIAGLPGKSFVWGVVGLILIPIVSVLLLVTIVGIPLGLFFLSAFCWVAYLSQLSLGVFLGNRLFGMEGKTGWHLFWAMAVGVVIIQALTFVPYIRPVIILAGLILGSGAILLELKAALYEIKLQLQRRM